MPVSSLSDSHQAPAEHPGWNSLNSHIFDFFSEPESLVQPPSHFIIQMTIYNHIVYIIYIVLYCMYVYIYISIISQKCKAGTVPTVHLSHSSWDWDEFRQCAEGFATSFRKADGADDPSMHRRRKETESISQDTKSTSVHSCQSYSSPKSIKRESMRKREKIWES